MRQVHVAESTRRVLLGCTVPFLAAAVLASCSAAPEPSVTSQAALAAGHLTTVAAVEKLWGSPLPMPVVRSAIRYGRPARRIRLRLSSVRVFGQEVTLGFNRGAVRILVGPAPYQDAGQEFRADLAAIGVGSAAIGTVHAAPAFVVQPRTDYAKSNPALVEFDLHGLDIYVMSTRLGTEALVAIADSISARGLGPVCGEGPIASPPHRVGCASP